MKEMKKIVLSGFSNTMIKCLTLVLKDISVMPQNENLSIENEHGDLLLINSNGAYPESQAVALIRELRKSGCVIPVIVLGFSRKNVHRVFFYKRAHKYLIYPFDLQELREQVKNIEGFASKREARLFYEKFFCDKEYLRLELSGIVHDVKGGSWEGVRTRIEAIASCISDEKIKIVKELEENRKNWAQNQKDWQDALSAVEGVINEL